MIIVAEMGDVCAKSLVSISGSNGLHVGRAAQKPQDLNRLVSGSIFAKVDRVVCGHIQNLVVR